MEHCIDSGRRAWVRIGSEKYRGSPEDMIRELIRVGLNAKAADKVIAVYYSCWSGGVAVEVPRGAAEALGHYAAAIEPNDHSEVIAQELRGAIMEHVANRVLF